MMKYLDPLLLLGSFGAVVGGYGSYKTVGLKVVPLGAVQGFILGVTAPISIPLLYYEFCGRFDYNDD